MSPTVKRASTTDANNYGKPVSSISQAAYDSIRSHNDKLALENERLSREAHTANQAVKSAQAELHRLEIEVR